jgi:DNA-binding response OmpR family regulator
MQSVLLIDDEPELAAAVSDALVRHGFDVTSATTLAEGRALLAGAELILLDLGLPDGDGLTACTEFADAAPVIVISARGEEIDRVLALELGADDYLAKPFSTRELVARCRAVLRRSGRIVQSSINVLDLEINARAYTVQRAGRVIDLTTKEMELLLALARRPGSLVRRAQLADEVWGAGLGAVTRTLEVHVSSLRAKLGAAPDGGGYIDTVHGGGYRLRQ